MSGEAGVFFFPSDEVRREPLLYTARPCAACLEHMSQPLRCHGNDYSPHVADGERRIEERIEERRG